MAFIQVQLYFRELWMGYWLIFQKLLVDWMTFLLLELIIDQDHLNTLSQVLERLLKYGFKLNKSKCKFLQSSVVYLGHLIDSTGLHPTMDKLAAVRDAPPPKVISWTDYVLLAFYASSFYCVSTTEQPP